MTKINEHSPERAAKLSIWKRNRDHCAGADKVKGAKTLYLAKPYYMTDADYTAHLAGVEYFPAASRTLASFTGLIFRKAASFVAPGAISQLGATITATGQTLEEFARDAFAEYATTNDGAILVDFPPSETPLSVADAIAQDIRPFLSLYRAHTILEARYSVRGGRKVLSYVRLADSDDQVRELELIEGQYTVTLHQRSEGNWSIVSRIVPLKAGRALTAIPLTLLNDSTDRAAFDDLCELNNVHYQHSSKLSTAMLWISAPIVTLVGVADDVKLHHEPGALWRFEGSDAKAEFLEYTGEGVPALERHLERIEKHLAWLGSRMLVTEKAPAEDAGSAARRHSSENSILAMMARHVSSRIEASLKTFADWWGQGGEVTFKLNTDFAPMPVDPALLAQVVQLNMSGKLPDEAFFEFIQTGELISEAWTYERYRDSIDTDPIV